MSCNGQEHKALLIPNKDEYQSLYKTIKPGHPQQLTRAPLISRRFYSKLISNIGEIVIPHEYNISFVN